MKTITYEFRWAYGWDPIEATSDEEAQCKARSKMHARIYHEPYLVRVEKTQIEIEATR
jgi:hypothetical protein